jgi:hypothetical protein
MLLTSSGEWQSGQVKTSPKYWETSSTLTNEYGKKRRKAHQKVRKCSRKESERKRTGVLCIT